MKSENEHLKLIIDNEYYDFVKRNNVIAESTAVIEFNNCKYDITYTNNRIMTDDIFPLIIATKDKLIFPAKIYDEEFIEYIIKNTTKVIVKINCKQVKYYPDFIKIIEENGDRTYLKDLILIEY